EIGGVMVDGVAVERQKASVAYETEFRRSIDPGLVEQASANLFRTRLYPIWAARSRSIRIQYVTELTGGAYGTRGSRSLPVGWGGRADFLSFHIEITDAEVRPKIGSSPVAGLLFSETGHGFAAGAELRNPPNEIVVSVPPLPEHLAEIESRKLTQD